MRTRALAILTAALALPALLILATSAGPWPVTPIPSNVPIGEGLYSAILTGYKLTPPVASDGMANLVLRIHRSGGSFLISFDLFWSNLEGNVTRAYLSFGEPWQGGQKILTLCEPCPKGSIGSYSRSAWSAIKPEELNYGGSFDKYEDFVKALWLGRVWVVLETTAHPSGEVGAVLERGVA
jgi:hypothetical protein